MPYGESVAAQVSASAATRSLEWAKRQREVDADRRHERRLLTVGEALRSAIAGNAEVFAADAPVEAMATAAVAAYERVHGR